MSMRSIYRKIAKQNGVSIREVKDEMQKAIDAAWDNPDKTAENIYMQNSVRPDGRKPTPEEIIQYASQSLRNEKNR
jgi:hypothetical protein